LLSRKQAYRHPHQSFNPEHQPHFIVHHSDFIIEAVLYLDSHPKRWHNEFGMSDWKAPLIIDGEVWDFGHLSIAQVGGPQHSSGRDNSERNGSVAALNGSLSTALDGSVPTFAEPLPTHEYLEATGEDGSPLSFSVAPGSVPDGPSPDDLYSVENIAPLCRCDIEVIERNHQTFRAFIFFFYPAWFELKSSPPENHSHVAQHARQWLRDYLQSNRGPIPLSRSDRPLVVHVRY
jgi:hypothetical protein